MRMKPKAFTTEQLTKLKDVTKQTPFSAAPKSTDPVHFPVFDIPVNDKVLIYVPNHTVVDENGNVDLRMDKPFIHTLREGKRYLQYRCVRNLSEELGYSGNCPICDGEDDPWTLANLQIKEECAQQGLDPADKDNEAVKTIKRKHYSDRVIQSADQSYTFPIVVIETDATDHKTIIMDENGVPKHKVYWYSISASAYAKKWLKALEGMDDEPTHPGGFTFILNYTYESKSGDYNKRDSAREMVVIPKRIKDFGAFAEMFDKETEEWDVAKAIETVVNNQLYEEADLAEEVERVLAPTRERIAIYEAVGTKAVNGEGFKLAPPTEGDSTSTAGLPLAGDTDEDE